MACGIIWFVLGLCFFGVFVPMVECRMREIFGARCQTRCLAKTISPGQTCNGSCNAACIKPCIDHENFYRVKSCRKYCREIQVEDDNRQCRSSCKYLIKLYNTGAKSGICHSVVNDTQSCSSSSCTLDNECPYLEKCCEQSTGCGKTCQKPLLNVTGYPSSPTSVNSTFIKKLRSVVIKWTYLPINPRSTSAVVFMVEVRHISVGSQQGVVPGEWNYINMTMDQQLRVTNPKSNAWSEYRVLAVKEQGTSEYSTPSSPIYIPPEKPTPPRNFRVSMIGVVKGKVRVELQWSKPEKSEVPIHRYRVFWSKRLDSHTKELVSLRVHHRRIPPDQHSAIINGLRFNTTYVFEIQAICRYKGQRLRSDRVYLTTRTREQEPVKKDVRHKKMEKVFRNSYKKPSSKKKTKPKPSGQALTPSTTSSVPVGRPENASRRPETEDSIRGTSSGNNIHACFSSIILLLLSVLYW